MPINYVRGLTSRDRNQRANYHLGLALAFVAGATNAGGYLAVHQYTSHMTGIVSAMADNLVLGQRDIVLAAAGGVTTFMLGAACSAVMINFGRRNDLQSEYAAPLLLEAGLLLGFGLLGSRLAVVQGLFVPATVMLLCFIMGLQNAMVSKLSHAEIRTTHVTGMITDIGIELGKSAYWNRRVAAARPPVVADRRRLATLVGLVGSFFVGGVAGAVGFKHVGTLATLPLAAILVTLAVLPALDDLRAFMRR
jgi:uncharacterized membrane protein YoaK (UPF0700 family)